MPYKQVKKTLPMLVLAHKEAAMYTYPLREYPDRLPSPK